MMRMIWYRIHDVNSILRRDQEYASQTRRIEVESPAHWFDFINSVIMADSDLFGFHHKDLAVYSDFIRFERREEFIQTDLCMRDVSGTSDAPLIVVPRLNARVAARRISGRMGRTPILGKPLVEFFEQLSFARISPDGFRKLKIAAGEIKDIYLRESFYPIKARIDAHFSGTVRRFAVCIVTGPPGIGKSMFCWFLLWTLVCGKQRVLFRQNATFIYFDGGTWWEFQSFPHIVSKDPASAGDSFWRMDLTCLVDGSWELGGVAFGTCNAIIVSSPDSELFADFHKYHSIMLFIPVWSFAELKSLISKALETGLPRK
jgi:hypothetical protein